MQTFPHHIPMGIGEQRTYSRNDGNCHAYIYKDTTTLMRAFFSQHLEFVISNVEVCTRMRYDDSERFRPDFTNFSEAVLFELASLAAMYIEVHVGSRQVDLQMRKTASMRIHSLYRHDLAVVSVNGYVNQLISDSFGSCDQMIFIRFHFWTHHTNRGSGTNAPLYQPLIGCSDVAAIYEAFLDGARTAMGIDRLSSREAEEAAIDQTSDRLWESILNGRRMNDAKSNKQYREAEDLFTLLTVLSGFPTPPGKVDFIQPHADEDDSTAVCIPTGLWREHHANTTSMSYLVWKSLPPDTVFGTVIATVLIAGVKSAWSNSRSSYKR